MLSIELWLVIILLFMFGSAIGSFLHVVAERYIIRASSTLGVNEETPSVFPARSALSGRSMCPYCKKTLRPRELVPIFSYVFQRGKCRSCKASIPMHYLLLEIFSGLVCVALLAPALLASGSILMPMLLYITACVLLVLTHIDMRTMMLPDSCIAVLTVLSIIVAIMWGISLDSMVLGVLIGAGTIYTIWLVTKGEGIGFGDVKLMIPLGILFGVKGAALLLFLAFCIGGMVGVFLLMAGRAGRKTAIPFGPFLSLAAIILMIFPSLPDRFFALLGV